MHCSRARSHAHARYPDMAASLLPYSEDAGITYEILEEALYRGRQECYGRVGRTLVPCGCDLVHAKTNEKRREDKEASWRGCRPIFSQVSIDIPSHVRAPIFQDRWAKTNAGMVLSSFGGEHAISQSSLAIPANQPQVTPIPRATAARSGNHAITDVTTVTVSMLPGAMRRARGASRTRAPLPLP